MAADHLMPFGFAQMNGVWFVRMVAVWDMGWVLQSVLN